MAYLVQLVDGVVVQKFNLTEGVTKLGRHPSNAVVIDNSAVSSKHAAIAVKPNPDFPEYKEAYIRDFDSTNGTYVNDVRISDIQRLHHNDTIRLAWNSFRFIDEDGNKLAKTMHMASVQDEMS